MVLGMEGGEQWVFMIFCKRQSVIIFHDEQTAAKSCCRAEPWYFVRKKG